MPHRFVLSRRYPLLQVFLCVVMHAPVVTPFVEADDAVQTFVSSPDSVKNRSVNVISNTDNSLNGLTLFFTQEQRDAQIVSVNEKSPLVSAEVEPLSAFDANANANANADVLRKNVSDGGVVLTSSSARIKPHPKIQYSALLASDNVVRVLVNELPCHSIANSSTGEFICSVEGGEVERGHLLRCPHITLTKYRLCLADNWQTLIVVATGTAARLNVGDNH